MLEKRKPDHCADFRFYGALNRFLSPPVRGVSSVYRFDGNPGIKDPIEAQGVPHTEVELLLVNGESVDFSHRLHHGDRVAVFPVFFQLDVAPLRKLRDPLPRPAFVLDVHLGALARLLRLLGMDTLYSNAYRDRELVAIAAAEQRVLLTRDRRLLFNHRVVHGHFVHATDPMAQAREVIDLYQLSDTLHPFSRCIACNGPVVAVTREQVLHRLKPKTARYYDDFFQCRDCGQVYWRGPHLDGMLEKLRALGVATAGGGGNQTDPGSRSARPSQ